MRRKQAGTLTRTGFASLSKLPSKYAPHRVRLYTVEAKEAQDIRRKSCITYYASLNYRVVLLSFAFRHITLHFAPWLHLTWLRMRSEGSSECPLGGGWRIIGLHNPIDGSAAAARRMTVKRQYAGAPTPEA
eukprot:1099500-Pleurochrysis_carterae.AAC.4